MKKTNGQIDLARLCKTIRKRMEISQAKLGELIGSNQPEISFMERGFLPRAKQKIDNLFALAVKCNLIEETTGKVKQYARKTKDFFTIYFKGTSADEVVLETFDEDLARAEYNRLNSFPLYGRYRLEKKRVPIAIDN